MPKFALLTLKITFLLRFQKIDDVLRPKFSIDLLYNSFEAQRITVSIFFCLSIRSAEVYNTFKGAGKKNKNVEVKEIYGN